MSHFNLIKPPSRNHVAVFKLVDVFFVFGAMALVILTAGILVVTEIYVLTLVISE